MRFPNLLFLITLAIALPASAAPIAINFDDAPSNTVIGSRYSTLGVTFSNARTVSFGSLAGGSAPEAIYANVGGGFIPETNPVTATFAFAVSSVSLTGLDIGEGGFILKAFDAHGTAIDTQQFTGVGDGSGTFDTLTSSVGGIFSIAFSQIIAMGPSGIDGIVFDNLVFTPAAGTPSVPEPESLALLGLGVVAIGVARRKRAG